MRHAEMVEYNGKLYTCGELEKLSGINCNTLRYRIRKGWSVEKALTEPASYTPRHAYTATHFRECFRCRHTDCIRAVDRPLMGERTVNKMFLPKVRPDEYY